MPHLQSIVIVLLKVILTNVTAMVTQPGQTGANLGYVFSSWTRGKRQSLKSTEIVQAQSTRPVVPIVDQSRISPMISQLMNSTTFVFERSQGKQSLGHYSYSSNGLNDLVGIPYP